MSRSLLVRRLAALLLIAAIVLVSAAPVMAQRGRAPVQAPSGGPNGPPPVPAGPPPAESLPAPAQFGIGIAREWIGEETDIDDEAEGPAGMALRFRVAQEEEEGTPPGIAQRLWAWSLGQGMTFARRLGFGVTPFMFYGTAEIDEGELIVDIQQGNRWALEGMEMEPAPTLDTDDAIIRVVYEDEDMESVLIEWEDLESILDECEDAIVQVFGFVTEDEEGEVVFKAHRITVTVPLSCSLEVEE